MALVEVKSDEEWLRRHRERVERARQRDTVIRTRILQRNWLLVNGEDSVPDLGKASWRRILAIVAERHGVSENSILGPFRHRPTVRARQEVMYLIRALTTLSTPQIGQILGKKDHTSVIHGVGVHAERNGLPRAEAVDYEHAWRMLHKGPQA